MFRPLPRSQVRVPHPSFLQGFAPSLQPQLDQLHKILFTTYHASLRYVKPFLTSSRTSACGTNSSVSSCTRTLTRCANAAAPPSTRSPDPNTCPGSLWRRTRGDSMSGSTSQMVSCKILIEPALSCHCSDLPHLLDARARIRSGPEAGVQGGRAGRQGANTRAGDARDPQPRNSATASSGTPDLGLDLGE